MHGVFYCTVVSMPLLLVALCALHLTPCRLRPLLRVVALKDQLARINLRRPLLLSVFIIRLGQHVPLSLYGLRACERA